LSRSIVGSVVAWNLIWLYPQTRDVAYVNDSAMHEQMVRFAARTLHEGSMPATHWYPLLNEGSPQFLHYQQLGALLAGAVGTVTSPTAVFHWSTYLLLSLWPVAIYAAGRVMRMPPLAAACAAAISPFLMSVPGVGYEQKAYVWIGFGMWAQLCGSWTLPFAWATTWRSMQDRRWMGPAAVSIVATMAFHFETGYLAILAVLIMPWVSLGPIAGRIRRSVVLLIVSAVGSMWVTVPLLLNSKWAAINTYLAPTGLVRGYGARRDLLWLVTGQTFDDGRIAVVTVAVLVGIVGGVTSFRNFPAVRPMVAMFVGSLLLSFGPTTWGPLVDIVPGHSDIFFRRFLTGVDLAGIYLAGLGVYLGATWLTGWWAHRKRSWVAAAVDQRRTVVVIVLLVCVLIPAMRELATYDGRNASYIGEQAAAEHAVASDLAPILEYIDVHGGGRVFAGSPRTGGGAFTVGFVPMYEFLANEDVDTVGFTMRTASLMSQAENFFDPRVPFDYALFGVRYVLLPTGRIPDVRAIATVSNERYTLWTLPRVHYLSVITPDGTLREDRSDIGPLSKELLRRSLFDDGLDPVVTWTRQQDGYRPATKRAPLVATEGHLISTSVDLERGIAGASVHTASPSIVVLSASFDPGWRAWVNGRPAVTLAVAPALVGVRVPTGTSRVQFRYEGFRWYPELVACSILGIGIAFWIGRRRPRSGATEIRGG
jgi:hypothetical protein